MTTTVASRLALAGVFSFAVWTDVDWAVTTARAQVIASSQTQSAPTPVKLGTAVILGRVVEDSAGTPVTGSSVCMWNTSAIQFCEVTDEKGRFLYRNLPAGSYHLVAEPGDFVRGEYGRVRPDGPARLIDVADGAHLMDVTIPVFKRSVISGTVLDEAGEPVVHATVQAAMRRPSSRQAGSWNYSYGGGSVLTDDRGRYRLVVSPDADIAVIVESAVFATVSPDADPESAPLIHSAARRPGETAAPAIAAGDLTLRLASGRRPAPVAPFHDASGATYVYPTTFYPSARALDQATLVRLAPGDERHGVDIALQLQRSVRVSGRVTGASGSSAGLTVSIRNQFVTNISLGDSFETALALTDANGRFVLAGVPAGDYMITVVQKSPPANAAAAAAIQTDSGATIAMGTDAVTFSSTVSENARWGREDLSVAADDIDIGDLALHAGFRATGEVRFDGAVPPTSAAIAKLTAGLFSLDGSSESVGYIPVDASGRFSTPRYPPGSYAVSVGVASTMWTLRSMIWQGRDIAHRAVTIENADLDGIVITFTDHAPSISGVVRGDRAPDADALVVAFPTDFRSATPYADVVSFPSVRVSAKGTYGLSKLPPGDYYVAAIDESRFATWTDYAFLDQLVKQATRVTLRDGDKATLDLHRVTVR